MLKRYKKGMMQKIFSQEIRFKDENGEEFPKWEEKKFSDVVSNKSSKYNPVSKKYYPCIEMDNIEPESGRLNGYYDSRNQKSIKSVFKRGDVLFGKLRPYLKKYLLANFDGVCSTEIWVLNGKNVYNSFLFYLIQTNWFIDLTNKSSGSKMPRADWNLVENGYIEIPSLQEQTKIANFLSAIDEKIALVEKQLASTKEYKKGLMQKLFI